MIKMGLKERNLGSITKKLDILIQNNWNFPLESTRPQFLNTLASFEKITSATI